MQSITLETFQETDQRAARPFFFWWTLTVIDQLEVAEYEMREG